MISAVGEDLSRLIENYITASKSRSLLTLANKAGVGYTTVRRLAQKEQNPTPATSLLILKVIADDDFIVQFSKKHWPGLGQLLNRFARRSDLDASDKREPLKELWQKPKALDLFCYASCELGRTKQEIVEKFGTESSGAFEWLLDNLLIREKNDRFVSIDFFQSDFASILHAMRSTIDTLIQKDFEKAEVASWQIEGLNARGVELVKNAAMEFAEQLEAIRSDDNNKGEDVTVAGVFCKRM